MPSTNPLKPKGTCKQCKISPDRQVALLQLDYTPPRVQPDLQRSLAIAKKKLLKILLRKIEGILCDVCLMA